jgi:ABC-2 type transport system permease protein
MNKFVGFVIKEFYHIIRDRRTLIIILGIPVIQLLLFGFVITTDIKDARIAIFDQSKDNVTTKLIQKILSSGYFKLDKYISSYNEIEQDFKKGKIKQVIVFENNFAQNLQKYGKANVQIISDGSDPNTSNLLVNYNTGIIADYTRELNQVSGIVYRVSGKTNMQIITEVRMLYNPELKSVYMFVPGLIGMLLILISAMMTSISITKEKELGTMEVLLVSPLRPFQIITGKVMPYIALSFINVIIVLLLAMFVFKIPIEGNIMLLLGECILYILVALSMGIFISTTTSSQQTAMTASLMGLFLPTMLLSGFIYPIENMPEILQWLCLLVPPRWFITILKNIMLKGNGFIYVWKETLILVGMMSFFMFLSVKKFKKRLE